MRQAADTKLENAKKHHGRKAAALTERFARGIPGDMQLYTTRPGVQLRGLCHSQRQCEYLDVQYAGVKLANPSMSHKEIITNLWGNPSQSVCRAPKPSSELGVGVITTSTSLYSFERDVVISGEGLVKLHGWDKHVAPLERFNENECRSLAGDSVSVPIAALMQCAMVYNPYAAWWRGAQ